MRPFYALDGPAANPAQGKMNEDEEDANRRLADALCNVCPKQGIYYHW